MLCDASGSQLWLRQPSVVLMMLSCVGAAHLMWIAMSVVLMTVVDSYLDNNVVRFELPSMEYKGMSAADDGLPHDPSSPAIPLILG